MFRLKPLSDRQIVNKVLGGEVDAFRHLVDRYSGVLLAIARAHLHDRAEAEDVTQNVFIKAYVALNTLQGESLGAWLVAVLRNNCFDVLRRRRVAAAAVEEATARFSSRPEISAERQEVYDFLWLELERLDPEDREVLTLYYVGRKRLAEIGALLNVSRDAAAKRLQRARETLGHRMVKRLGENEPAETASPDRTLRIMGFIALAPAPWRGSAPAGLSSAGLASTVAGAAFGTKLIVVATIALIVLAALIARRSHMPASPQVVNGTYVLSAPPTAVAPSALSPKANRATELSQPEQLASQITPGVGVVRGRVLDPKGLPVADAEVTLERRFYVQLLPEAQLGNDPLAPFKVVTRSDGDGEFRFDHVPIPITAAIPMPAGVHSYCFILGARKEDLFSATTMAEFGVSDRDRYLELVLHARGRLYGVVTNESGVPVASAFVSPSGAPERGQAVNFAESSEIAPTQTDSEGHFLLDSLAPGDYRLIVWARGREEVQTPLYHTGAGSITVVLATGARISGVVLDPSGNTPASGIGVIPWVDNGARTATRGMATGADGTFALWGIPPGKCRLISRVDSNNVVAHNLSFDAPEFELKGNEVIENVRIKLRPAGSCEGRVIDATAGKAIPYARVQAWPGDVEQEVAESYIIAYADETGRFALTGLPAQTCCIAAYGNPGQSARHVMEIRTDQTLKGVDLKVEGLRSVTGAVTDTTGAPLALASVLATYQGAKGEGRGSAATDSSGAFTLRVSTQWDTVSLEAVHSSGFSSRIGPLAIKGPGMSGLHLTIEAPCEVAGVVLSPDSSPAAAATVKIVPLSSAKPIDAMASRSKSSDSVRTVTTGQDGHFSVSFLRAGPYTLQAYAPGLSWAEPALSLPLTLAAGEQRRDLRIVLKPSATQGATVEGTVQFAGKPLLDATLYLGTQSVSLDAQGRYRVENIPPGDLIVRIQCVREEDGFQVRRSEQRMLQVRAGSVSRADFNLGAGACGLEGLFMVNGRPIADAEVNDNAGTFGVATNAQGRYRITGLTSGTVEVWMYTPGPSRAATAELAAGRMTRLDFNVGLSAVAIALTGLQSGYKAVLLLVPGEPSLSISDAQAVERLRAQAIREEVADSDRTVRVSDVEPGAYTVVVGIVPENAESIEDALTSLRVVSAPCETRPDRTTEIGIDLS